VLPRKPGHQPQHHYAKVSRMTQKDAASEILVLTSIAMQNCVATSTTKTYSSAWNSWVRVAEVFRFPTHCMHSNSNTPLPSAIVQQAIIQYVSWQCGVCMLAPKSIRKTYLPGIAKTMDRSMITNNFRESSKSPIVRCVLDGYRNMWARQHPASDSIKIPFTTVLAKESIRLINNNSIQPHGLNLVGRLPMARTLTARIYAALMFGIFFLLRKSEYLTIKDPAPSSSGARILRRHSIAFFDQNNARIPYQRIGHWQAYSIRLVINFSKTDQLGLGRLLIHCRQNDIDVNCIVSIMENWIASTRDQYRLSESFPVWTIPDYPDLTGDVISEVMKSTCDIIGLPRSQVSSHSLRYGGATELAAAGFPQYIIATYGGWTENSKAMHIYTRLSTSTNELVSRHMARAGQHRTVQAVVNDLLMHRKELSQRNQVSSDSDSSNEKINHQRKGGKTTAKRGK